MSIHVICDRSRIRASESGMLILIDVTNEANKVGLNVPTMVTVAVWNRCITATSKFRSETEALRCLVQFLAWAYPNPCKSSDSFQYETAVLDDERGVRRVWLKGEFEPNIAGVPVITLKMPYEN